LSDVWLYLKVKLSPMVPKELDNKHKEIWIENHLKELSAESAEPSDGDEGHEDHLPEDIGALSSHSVTELLNRVGFPITVQRPTTKAEWSRRDAHLEQVKRNRIIFSTSVTFLYSLLLRYTSWDVFILFLFALECGVVYLCVNYKQIGMRMIQTGARRRVNRWKDVLKFAWRREKSSPDPTKED